MRTPAAALAVVLAAACSLPSLADTLEESFKNPSREARPWTWWHWVSGHVSKSGITADLEAMNRVGLSGAQAFSVSQGPAAPDPVLYLSPRWRELMKHAIYESARLNLALTMHACEGWSESGGPWIRPEQSMQKVVWIETSLTGPKRVDLTLPKPEAYADTFSDIAVVAFPKLAGDEVTMANLRPSVRASGTADGAMAADGDPNTLVTIKPDKPNGPAFVECTFDHPVTIASLGLSPVSPHARGDLQISTDGKSWKTVGSFATTTRHKGRQLVQFDPVEVRAVRLYNAKAAADQSWTVAEVEVSGPRFPDYIARSGMEPKTWPAAMPAQVPPALTIGRDEVLDLTDKTDAQGRLTWDIPAGDWTILRLASTSTGFTVYPAMDQTRGLEADKMDRDVIQTQFAKTIGTVLEGAGPDATKGLKWVLLDSWEARCQNWTPRFREEFVGRRKYDPQLWLPTLTGRIVGDPELTERFLFDYRLTIAELIAENHFALYRDLCHKNGLKLMGEAVGIGMPTIADQLQCKGRVDVPMGEFWVERAPRDGDPKEAASAAHIYGQNIAAAEAFTAQAQVAGWRNEPAAMKALGDKMFTLGINHFVFHRYAHQPYEGRSPGVSMGPWGINFERTNTWWEQGRAWVDYIARCQSLLQRGRFVADLCYYYGEGAPISLELDKLTPPPPPGYDFDACNKEILLRMTVEDGQVVLPSGMRYRVLVLPDVRTMTPAVARKVRDLVQAGATVIGPKPTASPSLVGYPTCDEEVRDVAEELWGQLDGRATTDRKSGAGRIIWGRPVTDVLNVAPDFETPDKDVRYIHRRDGDADIYFVSNQLNEGRVVDCTFRSNGRQPELWWPDTGRIERATFWGPAGTRTKVRIPLEASGSVFVVFREKFTRYGLTDVFLDGKSIFDAREASPVGKLEITKAEYGAVDPNGPRRDVTKKVAAAVKDGTLRLPATNAALGGDAARLMPKQLRVEYLHNGEPGVVTVGEGSEVRLPTIDQPAALGLPVTTDDGRLVAWKSGTYSRVGLPNQAAGGRTPTVVPQPVEIDGPWEVRFQPGRLAPDGVKLQRLMSWTDHQDSGLKYFSGTATYLTEFVVPEEAIGESDRVRLDLGVVKNLAEVSVNGKELGVLWKAPFTLDVTNAVKAGTNRLEARVTNLWPNRLIGDLNLPEDQRVTWTTHNPYKKDSPPLKSGLIGPVQVEFGRLIEAPGTRSPRRPPRRPEDGK